MLTTILLLVIITISNNSAHKTPTPEILVYYPKGLSVSIPHAPGIRLFAFHANFNKRITVGGSGEFYKQVVHENNGKWSFSEDSVSLNVGDTICYWITIVKDRTSYRSTANFTVTAVLPIGTELHKYDCALNISRLESELEILLHKNLILTNLLEKTSNAKMLTMSGRLPPDGLATNTVKFILREKLDLSPTVVSAERNVDGSINFEVSTLDEKLLIFKEAETKLNKSKIYIA